MQGQPQGVAEKTRDWAPGWRHRDTGRPCGEALPRFPLDGKRGFYDFRAVGSRLWFWLQDPFFQPNLTGILQPMDVRCQAAG